MSEHEVLVPWDEVPDSRLLQGDCVYEFEITEVKQEASRNGKLMYTAPLKVVEPKAEQGMQLTENFVFGSDEDPKAQRPETVKAAVGVRRIKQLFKAAGVPLEPSIGKMALVAKGQHVLALVTVETEQKEGPYKGTQRNRLSRFFAVGERQVGAVTPGSGAAPAVANGTVGGTKAAASTVTCPLCTVVVDRAAYPAHAEVHSKEE